MVEIKFAGRSNTNTFDHPYYVKGKGWSSYGPELTKKRYGIDAKLIEVGDKCLVYEKGQLTEISVTSLTERAGDVGTYNLTDVSNNHNFFANGVLVHNKSNSEIVIILKADEN